MQPLTRPQNKYWLTFGLCALAAALVFLPFYIVDGGIFLYAGDFNSQQIPFYYYANEFIKSGGGTFSWATDLGSDFWNSYSFYLAGSPFFWLTLLFPAAWQPFLMAPMLVLKFAVAGGGAYLWTRRWVKDPNMAVLAGCLYAFSGFTVYNVFFNHFVDVVALFPYLLWTLDEAVMKGRRGPFAVLVALNLVNNYFFFAGQVVFLLLYFICMTASGVYRWRGKTFGALAAESLLGCGMGCVLAWPALLSLSQNPRTVDPFSGFGYIFYSKAQQYGAILYSLFFPPDCPYMPVIFDEGVIKWTSMSAYLPLMGMAGVIAYLRCTQKTAFRRILFSCLVMALVPALNSAFYAMNSSYYARWWYMPILVMCAASVQALENEGIDPAKGVRPTVAVLLAFCVFAFLPVEEDGEWSLGVIEYPEKFWLNLGLALLGVAVFWLVWVQYRRRPLLARRLTAAVLAFGCLYSITHISIGKFAQWSNDAGWRTQQYEDARALAEKLPEGAYRIDDYECYDNVGLWMGKSCLQFFNSTVAPSIMEFYPQFGVKRDVRSEPGEEDYALRGLLAVKYTVTPVADAAEFEKEAGDDWAYWGAEGSLAVYENKYALPMAYGYEYYVTEEQFEGVPENQRANLLLRAMVLSEEQIEAWGGLLQPLPEDLLGGFSKEAYHQDVVDRQIQGAAQVSLDSCGLSARFNLQEETVVLLAVPWDPGFTVTVNGEETPVEKVDGGLCAVRIPAGEADLRLDHFTFGLGQSLAAAGVSVALFAGYLVWHRRRRAKRAWAKPAPEKTIYRKEN